MCAYARPPARGTKLCRVTEARVGRVLALIAKEQQKLATADTWLAKVDEQIAALGQARLRAEERVAKHKSRLYVLGLEYDELVKRGFGKGG